MQIRNEKKFEITGKVIGLAMKVHSYFGSGFPEMVYHRSLMIEMGEVNLCAESEVEKIIYYKGYHVGKRRIDMIVENMVLIELKAVREIENDSYNQVLNCMKICGLEIGLLLNFGKKSLEVKRFAI